MSQHKPDTADHGPPEIEHLRLRLCALEAGRRALLDAVPTAAAELDASGRVVACNGRFAALCGATVEELTGKPLSAIRLSDAARLERRPLPSPAEGELVVDVAEEERAEQALRESEEHCRSLIDDFHLGVTVHGPGAEVLQVNAAALAMLGLTEDELLGKTSFDPDWDAVREDGTPLPGPEHPVPQAIRTGRPIHNMAVGVYRPKTQDRIWLLVSADPQLDAEGRVRRVVASFSDITERKRDAEAHKALERKMQEAQRLESLGVLAGGVAHDFNNLLTGIIGYTSLVRRETTGATERDYLDRVLQSAQRAAELCGQMLAYAGRGRFVVGPLDLSQVVRDQAALLQASVSRKALLSLELTDDLPPVLADAAQVRQVVLNLAVNASEALGERGGSVAVRTGRAWCNRDQLRGAYLDDDLPEGEYVFIEVADTGCGMDAETRRRVFEPFFTTKFLGRGLGLAAVLGIVRGHHGAIDLTTEPGLGTTVRVWFPRAPEAPPTPAAEPAPAREGGTVLFVDDEPALRDLAVRTLRPAGYEVLTAADGREALEALRARSTGVKLVVLDLTMPGLDVEETLRGLHSVRPNLPVILSSGYGEQEATRYFAAGELAGFLPKPYRPHQLLEKIRQALG